MVKVSGLLLLLSYHLFLLLTLLPTPYTKIYHFCIHYTLYCIHLSTNYSSSWGILNYTNIGCICSPSSAFAIVSLIYTELNNNEDGFVIGLSCLNGTK